MALEDTDNLIVQRDSNLYNVTIENMSTIQDTDLLLVQRGSDLYHITGEDLPSGGGVAPEILNLTLSENDTGGDRFTNETFNTNVTCNIKAQEPIVYGLKAKVEGDLVVQAQTSVITGTSAGTVDSGFAPVIYTGNANSGGSGNKTVTGVGFSPALVWIKAREADTSHQLFDSVRGPNKVIYTDSTLSEQSPTNGLTSFDSDGFSLGNDLAVNDGKMVAWCWDASDTTVTNNEGTIESQVRSNGNFSVVSFTSDASGNFSIGHGLSDAPKFAIVKTTGSTSDWTVYHESVCDTTSEYLVLNSTASVGNIQVWGAALPTSSVIGLTSGGAVATNQECIAYCWAESSTQSFGSYTGNGSTTGPVIDCGFEPAFVLIKRTNGAGPWNMYDSTRSPSNPANALLLANTSDSETNNSNNNIDFLSTGFQLGTATPELNGSGDTYIYAAFGNSFEGTTLELTDDSGLTQFSPGDDIVQNGSGTPVSSAITNVGTVSGPIYSSTVTFTNLNDGTPEDMFDGSTSTALVVAATSGSPNSSINWTTLSSMQDGNGNVTAAVRIYAQIDGTYGYPDLKLIQADDTIVYQNTQTIQTDGWLDIGTVTFNRIEYDHAYKTGSSTTAKINAIELDGEILVDSTDPYNVLTLTDDTNLANFRVGDVVQGSGTGEYIVWTSSAANSTTPLTSLSQSDYTQTGPFASGTPAEWVGNKTAIVYDAGAAVDWNVYFGDIGIAEPVDYLFESDDFVTWTSLPVPSSPDYNCVSSKRYIAWQSSYANWLGATQSGTGNPPVPVKITAIDEAAPSITTDGGTWNVGDPVTGPSFTATGTVASVDVVANTMTLSTSDGRWLVTEPDYQEDLKLNTKAQSTDLVEVDSAELFCIFDAEGNISDLSSNDPGFKDMLSDGSISAAFNLTFPALFPSMETPDERLPKGTTLCVNAKATNAIGSAVSEEACVTPIEGDGPTSSMYGLRFDQPRGTSLGNATSMSNIATYSCWFKYSGDQNDYNAVIAAQAGGINKVIFGYGTGGGYYTYDSIAPIYWNVAPVENEWQNIVVTVNDKSVVAYINGTQVADLTTSEDLSLTGVTVGTNGTTPTEGIKGYLSEVYAVDGQALEPTAFGYDYENQGKWAPLASTVIKQNIAAAGGFGENGFYLPFNPAATGQVWSAGSTGWSNPTNAFDGESDTFANSNSSSGTDGIFSFSAISGNLKLYVTTDQEDDGTATYSFTLSDGSVLSTDKGYSGGAGAVIDFGTVSNITSITAESGGMIWMVELDGSILVDHNNIGVDDSGNDNNFHDQNFAVGNTSQVWSSGASPAPVDLFNGNLSNGNDGDLVWTNPTTLTIASSLEFYSYKLSGDTSPNNKMSVVLSGVTEGIADLITVGTAPAWWSVPNVAGKTLDQILIDPTSAPWSPYIRAVRVDGKILVDANIQDTVTDTPLKNYAVLEVGTNGNLVSSGVAGTTITYLGEPGTTYYLERDGVGEYQEGGSFWSTSGTGQTFNFGQQPFANQYNTSQVWSSSSYTSGGSMSDGWSPVFNGDVTSGSNPVDGTEAKWDIGFSNAITGAVELYLTSGDGTGWLTINGEANSLSAGSANHNTWTVVPGITSLYSIGLTGSASPARVSGVKVGGKILVDAGTPLATAYGNTLSQTWEQWNNVATLNAANPASVLVFNAIKTAVETYEGDCAECRQEVINSLVKIVASGVLTNAEEEHLAKFMRTLIN